ncbi:hypothetical protein EJ074_20590 [Mesorhizobium sp. M3A.F.Ca.ET.080.04.2.1]|uniref:winged helix domain-containing protein n=1 Tax=Mesorhizobium sp. M3A.F.Ca.ET.080.04.2.1 TaxID=2493676 RepID=UPI000F7575B1|nr:hypothetical protein [Mesorhizobium sp. M3A.F.Ca.ET.080.04.2.1]AZO11219.1 hypothetical protein EJ074_20590 [Mesorhizobium sp. M3A.F.Ca.ET.080.04.2.1]RWF24880.1 MAG: hypothetical protein EOS64_06335 [Mesorhizobium sp.]
MISDSKYRIRARVLPDGEPMTIYGREAWCLERLMAAGSRGCTPIEQPAPRWSAYVHDLRHKFGLVIETIHEPHAGPFAGSHARYVLRSEVEIVPEPVEGLV